MSIATNPNKVIALMMIAFVFAILFIIGSAVQLYFSSQVANENLKLNRESLQNDKNRNAGTDKTNEILQGLKNLTNGTEQGENSRLEQLTAINNNTEQLLQILLQQKQPVTAPEEPTIHYNSSNSSNK